MSVPTDDRGLLLGDGLFETILARDGDLVLWEAHLARLTAGCAAMGLPVPNGAEARALCEASVKSVADGRAAVRLTVTAGSGGRGLDRPTAPRLRMFATAALSPKPEGPVQLFTAQIRRNETSPASRMKTLSYLDNVLARREGGGSGEALMLNSRGELACAAAANLFWLADGRVHTPGIECGVLEGIMRGQVLEAAAALGLEAIEVRVPREALDQAEAVFLTNSLIGVRIVDRLDGRPMPQSALVAALSEAVAAVS